MRRFSQKQLFLVLITLFFGFAGCVERLSKERAAQIYLQAKNQYSQGDLKKSEKTLQNLLSRNPDFFQGRLLSGKILFFSDQLTEAKNTFSRLLADFPSYKEADIWLVRTCARLGLFEEAEQKVKKLLAFDSEDPRLLTLLGNLYDKQGQFEKALTFYRQATHYSENLGRVNLLQGKIYSRFGVLDKAARAIDQAKNHIAEDSPLYGAVNQLHKNLQNQLARRKK